jgi:drug/metabolite transporter (DMT)-like permease
MTQKPQTYAEYVNNLSSVRVTMLSLLSGFTFTTITILINQLPDPNSTMSNIALLFLTIIFDLLLFLLGWQIYIVIGLYDVRDPPPHSRWELSAFNGVLLLVFYMWGASPALIYLIKNLYTLATVSGAVWTIFIIISLYIGRHMTRRLGWSIKDELKKIQKTTPNN